MQLFHTTDYDMSDETLKECLPHWYEMKLHKHTSHENDEIRTNKWPQFFQDDVEHDDIYVLNEFICTHCRKSLWKRKTKDAWPGTCKWSAVTWHPTGFTKHIAIGEKSDFSMNSIHNILVLRWYGGHYKVNGPPVSVPATLDQIIELLPGMPSELQLHPVKLKCKLEYKIHYMYDMIHRDCAISVITWLKEHNFHYADIKLNEHWYNDIAAKELSVQLDENDNHITDTEDAVLDQPLQKENTSKDKINKEDNQQTIHQTNRIYKCRDHWHWKWWGRYWTSWRAGCSQLQARINRWPFAQCCTVWKLGESNLSMCTWGK